MTVGQGRNGNTRMMKGHILGGKHSFLAPEQVNIGQGHQNMAPAGQPLTTQEAGDANAEEKNDLYQPEEKVYKGQIGRNIFSGNCKNEDVNRHKEQTSQVHGTAVGLVYVR
jgi:hypothetical protein